MQNCRNIWFKTTFTEIRRLKQRFLPFIEKMLIQILYKKIKRLKTVKIIFIKAAGFKIFKIAENAAETI